MLYFTYTLNSLLMIVLLITLGVGFGRKLLSSGSTRWAQRAWQVPSNHSPACP